MATFIAAIVVFGTAILGLGVGVVLSNRCLQGSCGGLNNLPEGSNRAVCDSCAPQTPAKTESVSENEPVA